MAMQLIHIQEFQSPKTVAHCRQQVNPRLYPTNESIIPCTYASNGDVNGDGE